MRCVLRGDSNLKTLIRTLLLLSLIVWLGAEIFFPVVAAITFSRLGSTVEGTHVAGQIVGSLLRILHGMGLVSGVVLLALLALAPAWGIFKARSQLAAMALVLVMVGLTAYSQYGVIPAMERDRIAVGGVINAVPHDNPAHADFDRLHTRSTWIEEGVLLLGIVVVALIASAETAAAMRN